MQRAKFVGLRLVVVVAVMAAVLVPALVAPARTISLPRTMAATKALGLPARAPRSVVFEFPATHVAFSWTGDEGTGVRFRTVEASGKRSEWQEATEAHDAERGDRHFSAVIAVDRIAGIVWQGVARKGLKMGPVTLDYLNTLDGDRYERQVPAVAQAAANAPNIVTRAEWGADESLKSTSGGCQRSFYKVQQLFVHHTAGANFDTRPKATMRAIYWYHAVRQGWCDIGYNFVISPDGQLFEGRWARNYAPFETHDSESRDGRAVAGAHVAGYNSGSIGFSLMGNYEEVQLPPAARKTLAEVLAWETDRHNLDPQGVHKYRNPETGATKRLPRIAGHRDAGYTSCPGRFVYGALPAIRKDVKAVMGAGKLSTSVTLQPTAPVVGFGESATFNGLLTDQKGTPLPARSIRSYMKIPGAEWTDGPATATAADGTFSLTITPRKNTKLIAVYDGDTATWGATSSMAGVKVRPEVTLQAQGAAVDALGIAHFPSTTTNVVLSGGVRPMHTGHDVVVRVSRLNVDGTYTLLVKQPVVLGPRSGYEFDYLLPEPRPGTYRALTWFGGDADHPRSPSPELHFVIDP